MKLSCTITTDAPHEHVEKLFATELAREHTRSKIVLSREGNTTTFNITADDVSSLRAAVNSITSILIMYEKTAQALHGN